MLDLLLQLDSILKIFILCVSSIFNIKKFIEYIRDNYDDNKDEIIFFIAIVAGFTIGITYTYIKSNI